MSARLVTSHCLAVVYRNTVNFQNCGNHWQRTQPRFEPSSVANGSVTSLSPVSTIGRQFPSKGAFVRSKTRDGSGLSLESVRPHDCPDCPLPCRHPDVQLPLVGAPQDFNVGCGPGHELRSPGKARQIILGSSKCTVNSITMMSSHVMD